MDTSESFHLPPLFAAALARLRDWLFGTRRRSVWGNRDSAAGGPRGARPAAEAAYIVCESSAPPGA
jgi:hypothetical protein